MLNSRTNQRGDQIVEVAIEPPDPRDERTRETAARAGASFIRKIRARKCGRRSDHGEGEIQSGIHDLRGGGAVRDPSADAAALRAGRLLKPSRSDGNTRLYTDEDLERLEVILHLTRDLGVNLAGVEIILNMREKMGEMQSQIQEFVATLNRELAARAAGASARRKSDQPDSGHQRACARSTRPPGALKPGPFQSVQY